MIEKYIDVYVLLVILVGKDLFDFRDTDKVRPFKQKLSLKEN